MEKLTPEREAKAIEMLEAVGHKREDILVALGRWYEGEPLQTEVVDCWRCDGAGTDFELGCIGGSIQRCSCCHGSGKKIRTALPKR